MSSTLYVAASIQLLRLQEVVHGVKYVPGFAGICLFYYSWPYRTFLLKSERANNLSLMIRCLLYLTQLIIYERSWWAVHCLPPELELFSVVSNVHLEHSIHSNDDNLEDIIIWNPTVLSRKLFENIEAIFLWWYFQSPPESTYWKTETISPKAISL